MRRTRGRGRGRGGRGGRGWRAARVCLLAAGLMAPATAATAASAAAPSRSDAPSARGLIAAVSGFYEAGLRTRHTARADVNHVIVDFRRRCPHVIPFEAVFGTQHQLSVAHQLTVEESADLWLAVSAPVVSAAIHEAALLKRLRFRSARANRDARQMARSQLLMARLRPSDGCADLRAAASGHYEHVPAPTRRLVTRFLVALGSHTPLYVELKKDIGLDLPTASRRDRGAFTRMRSLVDAYDAFADGVVFRAQRKLASVLAGSGVALDAQAGTTTAANTRSTSSSNEIPAASAASGRRLVSVRPGIGLTSST